MSTNIPEITIISEPSFDNETISITNDVLTDTEDLFEEQPIEKPKSKLKIKIPKVDDDDGAVTDVEDFETSDGEGDCVKIIEHNEPISLNDLDFETCTFEELLKSNQDDLGKKQNTQMQTLETPTNLRDEIENVLTDYEQFSTDTEIEEDTVPETDANFDDLPENSIIISDNYKENITANKFHENLTDCESIVPDNSTSSKKSKPRRRRTKHSNKQLNTAKKSLSLPLSPTCNDDSEDDRNHLGFTLCKSVVNSPQEVATDVEEIEESDEPIRTKPKKRHSIKVVEENVNLSVNEKQSLNDKESGDSVKKSSSSGTEEESLNEYMEEYKVPDINLPPPTRVLVLLQENQSLIPTTKILPLDEHQPELLRVDESSANHTDIESFKDNDDNLDVDDDNREQTSEIVDGDGISVNVEDNEGEDLKINKLDAITDNEQVLTKEQTKRNYLTTDADDSSSGETPYRTETENFETDTDENGANRNNHQLINPHTDTEELLADDEVQNNTGIMYLKGGSHLADDSDGDPLIFLNIREGSVSFGILKEWDVGKKPATAAEPVKETPTTAPETEQQGEEAGSSSSGGHREASTSLRAEGGEPASSSQQHPEQSRPIADQHQLSEEMKQLLKDLEKESKQ